MGKQRRRKNNKKGGKAGPTQSDHKNDASNSTGSSSLINKIRHGEVKIRHAALAALSQSLFSPESLAKSRTIKLELIHAMVERIMDDDVPCALCAVGCMANYVLFQEGNDDSPSQMSDDRLESILSPVLLTKMNKTSEQIKSMHEKMVLFVSTKVTTTSRDDGTEIMQQKTTKKDPLELKQLERMTSLIMDQFTLLSLTLHAFCGLIEIFSANNSSSSLLHHQRREFLTTIMNSFIISTEMIKSLTAAASDTRNTLNLDAATIVNKMISKKENETNIVADVAVYSARTIHSSADENPEFVKALLSSGHFWNTITSSVADTSLPTLARLHGAGTLIASRHFIVDLATQDTSCASLQSNLNSIFTAHMFPLLSSCTTYMTDVSSALYHQILVTESKLQEEMQDEKLEKDLIKMAENKKESARLIAKRQKEMKAQAKARNANNEDARSTDQDNAMTEKEHKKEEDSSLDDTEANYEKAVTAWKKACLPLKLSVEIIANLCSARTNNDNEEFDGMVDDEMGWDSDQEDELINSPEQNSKHGQTDIELFEKIISSGIPDQVLSTFGCILLSLMNTNKDSIPNIAIEDIFEVLTKCSMCLGNSICNIGSWKTSDTEISVVWKDFFQCLTAATNGEVSLANMILPCQAISPLLSTMTAFLRFRPSLGKCVEVQDLELILSYVCLEPPIETKQSTNQRDKDEMEAILDIQKDSISLLGILCSEPHPDEINQRICFTFLTVLSRSHSLTTSLMSELLNVLMDMYGADEGDQNNHEAIFRRNNVLDAFEKSIPLLKRKIRESTNTATPMEMAFWRETTLNASRFVKYKKG